MKIKNTSSCLAIVVLVLAAGLPMTAVADKTIEVNMFFAGAFATGILHVDPMTGNLVPSALIHVQAKGSPGKAVIRGYGAGADEMPVFTISCLGASSDDGFLRIEAGEDPLLFTFQDLSLLFANGDGEICINLTTGISEFRFDISFTGGTGRFEGAWGTAVITGEAVPVSNDGSFLAETGTIVGTIHLP